MMTEGLSKGPSEGLSWKQVAENLEINPDKLGLLVPVAHYASHSRFAQHF